MNSHDKKSNEQALKNDALLILQALNLRIKEDGKTN